MLPNKRLKNNITAILNSMETIVISTVKTFREDFFEDVKILKRAKVNEQYIWLVKTTGTWLLNLQEYKPSEYYGIFISNESVVKRYLIDTNKTELTPVTKEQAIKIAKAAFDKKYDSVKTYETITIHDYDPEKTTHYMKTEDGNVLKIAEERKGKQKIFQTMYPITKDMLIQIIKNIYKTIPKSTVTIGKEFTPQEIQKLYAYNPATRTYA